MRHALIALLLAALGWTGPARGADWLDAVIPERAHDFGTVARGSKVHHSFKVINNTPNEISYRGGKADVRLHRCSRRCSRHTPGTQTVIEATIDTTRFTGYKPSGLAPDDRSPDPNRGHRSTSPASSVMT